MAKSGEFSVTLDMLHWKMVVAAIEAAIGEIGLDISRDRSSDAGKRALVIYRNELDAARHIICTRIDERS